MKTIRPRNEHARALQCKIFAGKVAPTKRDKLEKRDRKYPKAIY